MTDYGSGAIYTSCMKNNISFEWHKELFEFLEAQLILLFLTPFYETAVNFLHSLFASAFKIA